jgi:hypothetical protein
MKKKWLPRTSPGPWLEMLLDLLPGTPVGTSLIDAHAGGVGVMEKAKLLPSFKKIKFGRFQEFF